MASWIIPPVPHLIETSITPEINVDGVGAVECHSGSMRFYLYTDQMPLEGNGPSQRVVCAKVICSPRLLPTVMGQLALCLVHRSSDVEHFGKPRLVT